MPDEPTTENAATAVLEVALNTLENNEPINRAEGAIEQADLEAKSAEEIRGALETLNEVSPPAKRIGHLQRITNLWRTFGSAPQYVRIRLQEESGEEFTVLLTENELREVRERAERNPEDVAKAPLVVDLTD